MAQGKTQQCDGYIIDFSDTKSITLSITLYRIRATEPRLGGIIPAGTLGGYIASPDNLSGTAWVDETSIICSKGARVMDNACVMNSSEVWGAAKVMDNAVIREQSTLLHWAKVGNSALIHSSTIEGYSMVSGLACVYNSCLKGSSKVTAKATILDSHLGGLTIVNKRAVVLECKAAKDEVFTGNNTYRKMWERMT